MAEDITNDIGFLNSEQFQEEFAKFSPATFIRHYVERDVPDGEVHVGEFSENVTPNETREDNKTDGAFFEKFPHASAFHMKTFVLI